MELRVLRGILIFVGYAAQDAKSAYGSESIVLPLFTLKTVAHLPRHFFLKQKRNTSNIL